MERQRGWVERQRGWDEREREKDEKERGRRGGGGGGVVIEIGEQEGRGEGGRETGTGWETEVRGTD